MGHRRHLFVAEKGKCNVDVHVVRVEPLAVVAGVVGELLETDVATVCRPSGHERDFTTIGNGRSLISTSTRKRFSSLTGRSSAPGVLLLLQGVRASVDRVGETGGGPWEHNSPL